MLLNKKRHIDQCKAEVNMIKFTVQQHFMSAKHNSTIVLIYYDKTRIYIFYHLRPLKPLMLQLDYAKLLDILTSFPESHAILLHVVWFVMSLPCDMQLYQLI